MAIPGAKSRPTSAIPGFVVTSTSQALDRSQSTTLVHKGVLVLESSDVIPTHIQKEGNNKIILADLNGGIHSGSVDDAHFISPTLPLNGLWVESTRSDALRILYSAPDQSSINSDTETSLSRTSSDSLLLDLPLKMTDAVIQSARRETFSRIPKELNLTDWDADSFYSTDSQVYVS